jgi:hypothetical protein
MDQMSVSIGAWLHVRITKPAPVKGAETMTDHDPLAEALRLAPPDLIDFPWEDQSPPGWRHERAATDIRAALDAAGYVIVRKDTGGVLPDGTTNDPPIDFDALPVLTEVRPKTADVRAALTSEDEIAHGEAVTQHATRTYERLGRCAYCEEIWPCRTQRGIDRLLAIIDGADDA